MHIVRFNSACRTFLVPWGTFHPTAPASETLPAWTNCTSYPTAPASEIPPAWTNLTSHPTAPAIEVLPAWRSCTPYPTVPASEVPPAWTNLTSYPTAPASEVPPSWMNLTSYPTGTGACWKPIPTDAFWPHPSGASVSCAGGQLASTGLNTTRRFLVLTTAPSIPNISSASDRYGCWSGSIGKWVGFCVVGVNQIV